jgi:hypothetical protein
MNVCLGRIHAASYNTNHIGGVMVRVLASSAVDRGFEPRSGHTKDYIQIDIFASLVSTQH